MMTRLSRFVIGLSLLGSAAVASATETPLVDNGNGTISDQSTGLTWEKKSWDDSIHNFDDDYTYGDLAGFIASLNGSSFGGFSDWRIPTIDELLTIADPDRQAILPIFQEPCDSGCAVTTCSCWSFGNLWSSSEAGTGEVWTLVLGDTVAVSRGGSNYIRAVRGNPVPTATPILTPSRTSTRAMPASPTRLSMPTRTPSRSPATAAGCAGDCDDDGAVTIAELIHGVNIVLGRAQRNECAALDRNGDGRVVVNELVAAVSSLLCSCRVCPTPRPTNTATPTPTATSTPNATRTATEPIVGEVLFHEGWSRAAISTYRPQPDGGGDIIAGDTGDWIVFDTVTNFEECGASPHFVEVISESGNRRLRLSSGNSESDCADNVDVAAITEEGEKRGVAADLTDDTFLSFRVSGTFSGRDPCDAVYLIIEYDRLNRLSYVLQRGAGWEGSNNCGGALIHPNPKLLDPNRLEHTRNLIEDAAEADFDRPRRITAIAFSIDSEGTATFDDIRVFRARSGSSPTPTRRAPPSPTPTTGPCTCVEVREGTWCLEGEGGYLEGRLSQSGCTITFEDESARGPICGNVWTVDNSQLELECRFSGGDPATQCSGRLSAPQGSGSFQMTAGRCPDDDF